MTIEQLARLIAKGVLMPRPLEQRLQNMKQRPRRRGRRSTSNAGRRLRG